MPDHHTAPLERVFADLGSAPDGLSGAEAARRLERCGRNELQVRQDTPEFVKFLRQFKNFFALLLIGGGALAIAAERLDPGQGNLYIAIALIAVVLLNAAFTYAQEHQSERIMDSFRRMLPSMVTVLRDGRGRRIDAAELVPGDVVLLHEGDRVPADGRLIEASDLKVDQSSLTGESEPVRLDPAARTRTCWKAATWCSRARWCMAARRASSSAGPEWRRRSAASSRSPRRPRRPRRRSTGSCATSSR